MKHPIFYSDLKQTNAIAALAARPKAQVHQTAFVVLLALLMILCWHATSAQAQSRDITKQIMQSVVALQVSADPESPSSRSLGPQRIGTGVVIGENLILTVGYLLIEAEDIDVLDHQQRRLPANVAAYDPASGFGLVKTLVPLKLQAVRMGDSDGLKLPRRLLTLGQSEKELTELFLVSRKPYAGNWEYLVDAPLMTIPAVNNWSGAGLFDDDGALIGIGSLVVADATGGFNPRPGNLYLPINLLKPILDDLLANGRRSGPAQAWLGIHSQEHPDGGLQIQRLSPDGPAALAGLQRGDRILALDNTAITGLSDFYRRLWSKGPAGSRVELTFLREGIRRKVQITSADRLASLRKPKGV
ncbi:MAG: S1C family serine protease [Betaproteobacteria bacterium]